MPPAQDAAETTDTDGSTDTGPSAQAKLCADYPENIACPTLPAPPQLEDGTDFSEWERSQCPAGAMPDFGKPGCIVIGDPCPEGDWPEDLPTDNIRYVTPGGTGDGLTQETAAGSIQAMLSATASGTTIALSKGRFEEHFEIARRQHVVGACARDTVIAGLDASRQQVVGITGTGESSFRYVTVTGSTEGVAVIETAGPVTIEGVIVERVSELGLRIAEASEVEASMLVVRDTLSGPSRAEGRGIRVLGGSMLKLSQGLVIDNHLVGLSVSGASRAELSEVTVLGTKAQASSLYFGRGISVQDGGYLRLERVVVHGNRDIGLYASTDTTVDLEDVVIRETRPQERDELFGWGIAGLLGSTIDGERVLLSSHWDIGLFAVDAGTSVELRDLTIQGTESRAFDGTFGRGINVEGGAALRLERARLLANRDVALALYGAETSAGVSDLIVEETESRRSDGVGGIGVQVSTGAQFELTRGLVSTNREIGVFVGRGYCCDPQKYSGDRHQGRSLRGGSDDAMPVCGRRLR